MNREIKFRAWDSINNRMQYDVQYLDSFNELINKKHWVVLQFTGLLDKNGKEIYEGDIVRILYTDWSSKAESDSRTLEQYLKDIAFIGTVVYNGNGFYINDDMSMFTGTHGYIEIIGNIYETPELLTNL